jgi:hypothetical protein
MNSGYKDRPTIGSWLSGTDNLLWVELRSECVSNIEVSIPDLSISPPEKTLDDLDGVEDS